MKSIRSRIQSALVASILFVGTCAVVALIVNQVSAFQNQRIIETMTAEYGIISMTDNLILAYNDVVKSPGDTEIGKDFQDKKSSLVGVLEKLKLQIRSDESRLTFVGVENTVKKVITECEEGLEEVSQNNFLNISNHFSQANANNDFVKENIQTLLQKELEYLSQTQANSQRVYKISIGFAVGLFLVVLIGMVIYSRVFSKQLTEPLELLSKMAKQIADGDTEVPVDQKLIDQKDETGILASSFAFMLGSLRAKILELDKTNHELASSKGSLESSNKELEKINGFMVDRELKMVELKKRIAELEKKS